MKDNGWEREHISTTTQIPLTNNVDLTNEATSSPEYDTDRTSYDLYTLRP